MHVCVCECLCARARVCACVRVCVCVRGRRLGDLCGGDDGTNQILLDEILQAEEDDVVAGAYRKVPRNFRGTLLVASGRRTKSAAPAAESSEKVHGRLRTRSRVVLAGAVCGERLERLLLAAARKVRDVVAACRPAMRLRRREGGGGGGRDGARARARRGGESGLRGRRQTRPLKTATTLDLD